MLETYGKGEVCSPSGTLCATHTADEPVSSGMTWKIHASNGSTTVSASPPMSQMQSRAEQSRAGQGRAGQSH